MLFATSPFKERERDINVWGLVPAAAQSGISRRRRASIARSPLGATYDAFDSERYILTFENRAFRDIAANAPYEVVEILTNTRDLRRRRDLQSVQHGRPPTALWAPYMFVHEFGHHLAGLADEYYTSDVAYLPAADRVEPWEPNVDGAARSGDAEVEGSRHARDAAADALAEGRVRGLRPRRFRSGAGRSAPTTGPNPRWTRCFARADGARHGVLLNGARTAGRSARSRARTTRRKGYYRPQSDCIMFTRDEVPFCAVCRRAIETILDLYSRP